MLNPILIITSAGSRVMLHTDQLIIFYWADMTMPMSLESAFIKKWQNSIVDAHYHITSRIGLGCEVFFFFKQIRKWLQVIKKPKNWWALRQQFQNYKTLHKIHQSNRKWAKNIIWSFVSRLKTKIWPAQSSNKMSTGRSKNLEMSFNPTQTLLGSCNIHWEEAVERKTMNFHLDSKKRRKEL